jgi:subtilisin family serine protease
MRSSLQRAPRRLLLTLALGEVPDHIPDLHSYRRGFTSPAKSVDGGVIDRLVAHHGGDALVLRLHAPRVGPTDPSSSSRPRYDYLEQLSGVARVLRVEVREDRGVLPLVDALAQLRQIEHVCADRLCHTPSAIRPAEDNTSTDHHWHPQTRIRLPQALEYEPGDPAVLIGLADSGVALDHIEIAAHLRRGFNAVELTDASSAGLTLVSSGTSEDDPSDEVGHGTACAGILVATGEEVPPGAAGACGLIPARVLGAALGPGGARVGVGALSDIDAGIKRLIDLGVRVINMSFGTAESELQKTDPRPHTEVVRYALARGVALVAASGNSGTEERYYPAADDGVIAVGSVDSDGRPSVFTTRGDHVAVSAPGREIWTCSLRGYSYSSGTSFAAPFVSAVCGLLVARSERRARPLMPEDVRDILMASARHFGEPGVHGCGSGVLDALGALRELDWRLDAQPYIEPTSVAV